MDEAAERIVSELDEASRKAMRETPRDGLSRFHATWGRGPRDPFGLGVGNTRLLESCGKPSDPDACVAIIVEAAWERLQRGAPARDAGP